MMVAGAFFLSVMALAVRIVGQRLPTMEIVSARSLVVLILSWVLLARERVSPWGRDRRLLLLRGLLGFTALTLYYYSLVRLPLADATVIQFTNPVWTALLAALLLSERMGPREIAASLASLCGVVLLARPTALFGGAASALPPGPVAVALLGAFLSGGAYVTVRSLGRREHPLVIVFWLALVSSALSSPFLVVGAVLPTLADLGLLAVVGLTTFVGQLAITLGLRDEPAGRATGVAYLQVLFAVLWGMLLLGEYPGVWTLVGALVILACTWVLGRASTAPPDVPGPA
jgi:drug/metabolite transporter (DMT)-like permease